MLAYGGIGDADVGHSLRREGVGVTFFIIEIVEHVALGVDIFSRILEGVEVVFLVDCHFRLCR